MIAQLFGIVWVWKARKAATTVEQAIAPLKPSLVGYQTVRRAGAAVNASQPAEYHPRTQRDDPAAAGRSHHHTRWLRGFLWIRAVPFAGDVLLKREFGPAMTLIVSLTAILLTTLGVVGWCRDA